MSLFSPCRRIYTVGILIQLYKYILEGSHAVEKSHFRFLSLQADLKVLDQKFFFNPWTQSQCEGRCAVTVLWKSVQHVEG